ncbi:MULTISPECIES: DUF550 domain-containing protein [Salmonella]|uniref:DUF550 domain-containing protein n=1 Tax=Salmonella TaxID=590 RepID=UPI001F4D6BF2|nr:DUF550 domain-containing protein [Salmonella enterica]MCW6683956.1 DUF550 domain-containing protein [Salmonella enterica subsp. enterica serovar Potsdam]MCW6688723.1 DUF550 domain-containing protein [Salmonella enterica subsp. enterica serovar Potsdam]MCW6693120.1 DUF550 domain-containing protein [Salmonella enterica subsp. enterica serovar Potsdam]MCW6703175.1 DUF550 domain-containing protein [Salmonella enterica subsp. enterica serovar Potsdam]MCW6707414.1 DUF550 domain-containing protein
MTTITKERIELFVKSPLENGLTRGEQMELARIALEALTAEPVAWTDAEELRDLRTFGFCEMFTVEPVSKDADMYRVIPLYTDSPVPERERIRREHAEWSDKTFGDVGPVGPLKHLSKEALEAAAEPDDLSEWADMQFLLWDAQRRAGISDGKITAAMEEKLKVNMARQWPEPKDGEPRLHIKEQPAPVVPPAIEPDYEVIKGILPTTNPDEYACCIAADMWNSCRDAMLQDNQRDLSQPVDQQVAEYEQIMLQAGWVMVPVEPTEEMIAAAMECDDVLFNSDGSFCVQFREIYCAMVDAALALNKGEY